MRLAIAFSLLGAALRVSSLSLPSAFCGITKKPLKRGFDGIASFSIREVGNKVLANFHGHIPQGIS